MPALSLRAKLLISVAAVIIASSIPLTILIQSKMRTTLRAEFRQRGVAIAHELAAQSVDLILTYNTYQLHDLVHMVHVSNRDVSYVFIADNRGRLLVHTFEEGFPTDLRQLVEIQPTQEYSALLLRTENGPLLDVAVPIYDGKGGTAHVGMSYERVGKTIDDTLRSLLITGVAGLSGVLLITYVLVGIVLKPLAGLMAAVQEVRRGNLQARAAVASRDEIGRFAKAFDVMVEELEQSRSEKLRLMKEASRLEAQAQIDRMRSEFLARASHELRTPVAAMGGYVETLMREDMELDEKTQRVLFQDMEHISDRLSRLVNDLLNVSRIDVGQLRPARKPLALGPAVKRAIRRFEMHAPEYSFTVQLPGRLPKALADPDLLDDILDNLLSNAVKYSNPGTSISVTVDVVHGKASTGGDIPEIDVSVGDEGIGIPDAELDRLFERFYRRSDGAATRVRGIGLGLYLCKTYAEAMGGKIRVESKIGKGSIFSFSLPTIESLDTGEPQASPEKPTLAREAARML